MSRCCHDRRKSLDSSSKRLRESPAKWQAQCRLQRVPDRVAAHDRGRVKGDEFEKELLCDRSPLSSLCHGCASNGARRFERMPLPCSCAPEFTARKLPLTGDGLWPRRTARGHSFNDSCTSHSCLPNIKGRATWRPFGRRVCPLVPVAAARRTALRGPSRSRRPWRQPRPFSRGCSWCWLTSQMLRHCERPRSRLVALYLDRGSAWFVA